MSGKAVPMGKRRDMEQPWLTIKIGPGPNSWEYRVLKAYTADPDNPYARWMCAVQSPYTRGGWDMGDTYIGDIKGFAGVPTLVQRDPAVPDEALPTWLRKVAAR